MTDRRAEVYAVRGADGEKGNLEIKIHHAFNDNAAGPGAAALLRILPGVSQLFAGTNKALAFTR